MMHKKTGLAAAIVLSLLCGTTAFGAVTAEVVYVEGATDYRRGNATFKALDFGIKLQTGDVVRTGKDGTASLTQGGVDITISPNTVFTLDERIQNGQRQGVLAVTLGSIKMKYDKISGQEPALRTASCVAGVRGTELTMFAGSDGASLIVVDSGAVEVAAEGKSVLLAPGEGVEVKPGQVPGDKFAVQRNQINYSTWDSGRLDALLKDPVASMDAVQAQLDSYAKTVNDYYADYQIYRDKLAQERAKAASMKDTDGEDASKKYSEDVVAPLIFQTTSLVLNYRYSALAALSMRRYVVGHMYAHLKAVYLSKANDPVWTIFLQHYERFLSSFEATIVPRMVEDDV